MKLFVLLACVASACAFAPAHIMRSPADDSAIIQFKRYGDNFAYRTDIGLAYAQANPIINYVRRPVGASYHHGTPIVKNTVVRPHATTYHTTHHTAPVGHVDTHIHRPATTTYHAPAVAAYHAPAYGYHAAPLGYAAGYHL